MKTYAELVTIAKRLQERADYTLHAPKTGVHNITDPNQRIYSLIEWQGQGWLTASHLADMAASIAYDLAYYAQELTAEGAAIDSPRWDECAEAIVICMARTCLRDILEGVNPQSSAVQMASTAAKIEARKVVGEYIGVLDRYSGFNDDDMRAVFADRARRAAEQEARMLQVIKTAAITKVGNQFAIDMRNKDGTVLRSVFLPVSVTTRKDARREAKALVAGNDEFANVEVV